MNADLYTIASENGITVDNIKLQKINPCLYEYKTGITLELMKTLCRILLTLVLI